MWISRRHLKLGVQGAVAVAVVAAVGWHFARLLRGNPLSDAAVTVRPGYLVASGVCYLAAHTLFGTFFWQLLRCEGARVSWLAAVRAYFVSQAGKYVPGKAWVLVLRMMLLRSYGVSTAVVGVTGTYETLTTMAAGAAVGVALLPWSGWSVAIGSMEWLGFLLVAVLPVVLSLFNGVLVKVVRRLRKPGSTDLPSPPVWLLCVGLVQASAGWCLLAAGVGLALMGLLPDPDAVQALAFPGLLAAVALSYVAGFASLILPGGLGARELLLQQMLAAQLAAVGLVGAAAFGVVAALTIRLAWTAAEVVFSAGLWWVARPRGTHG